MASERVYLPSWMNSLRVNVLAVDEATGMSQVEIVDERATARGQQLGVATESLVRVPDSDINSPAVEWPFEWVGIGGDEQESRLATSAMQHDDKIIIEIVVEGSLGRGRVVITPEVLKDLCRAGWQFLHSEVFAPSGVK